MQPRKILVQAPARLHFGLFSFGNTGRQFGGAGVMVERPSVKVEFCESDRFSVEGECAACVEQGAQSWAAATGASSMPACRVTVLSAPRRHVGLGSGTQLALSIAAGLNAWHQLSHPSAAELARLSGRGRRSAIGTYGFLRGGFIVESGKLVSDELAPLQSRLEFPREWRFVLVCAGGTAGLHGPPERKAFEALAPVSLETRRALLEEVEGNMIPALERKDCVAFGESLFRFGYQAGACFAAVQGGPYNGERVAALVDEIRALGVAGVGQSSWGPTLFCLLPDQQAAESLVGELERRHAGEDLDVCVTAADNQGAQMVVQ